MITFDDFQELSILHYPLGSRYKPRAGAMLKDEKMRVIRVKPVDARDIRAYLDRGTEIDPHVRAAFGDGWPNKVAKFVWLMECEPIGHNLRG
jgi:hypothetical protein